METWTCPADVSSANNIYAWIRDNLVSQDKYKNCVFVLKNATTNYELMQFTITYDSVQTAVTRLYIADMGIRTVTYSAAATSDLNLVKGAVYYVIRPE